MCGAPKEQVVTQKTELDPALRRHLYGGSISNPRGGFGSTAPAAAGAVQNMGDGPSREGMGGMGGMGGMPGMM